MRIKFAHGSAVRSCESCATSHTTGSRDPAWPHYRWRPRTAVGPRCTLHTHTLCRHTVPSLSRPVCGCSPVSLSEQQPSLSPSQFHLSTCLQVFTCSLGSLCFFESSTHSATALGLADPDYTIPTLINSEHRRTSPSLLDRMQYFNPGSVSGPPGVLISWLRPHPYIVCTSIEYTPTET